MAQPPNRSAHVCLIPAKPRSTHEGQDMISVLQLNILASNLGNPEYFPYVPTDLLSWNRRSSVLLSNILQPICADDKRLSDTTPSIICLEELSDYWTFFAPRMAAAGYGSVYYRRPSLHGTSWSGVDKFDGCGVFYRLAEWELVDEKTVNFPDEHDRIALIVLLRRKGIQLSATADQYLLVATTHLYWDKTKVDIQLAELRHLECKLRDYRAQAISKYSLARLPVVFCGDFNSTPDGEVYRFMRHEFLGAEGGCRSAFATYRHAAGLEGSGGLCESEANEPPFTTITPKRHACIDYIWFLDNSGLEVAYLGNMPTDEDVRKECGGIPNSSYGSDHLPLVAVFAWHSSGSSSAL